MRAIDFGFIFSRFVHYYSMSVNEVLNLDVLVFWMMHRNIDRLIAEKDYRSTVVQSQAMAGEKISEFLAELRNQMGTIVDMDEAMSSMTEKLDKAGLQDLKSLKMA